LILEINPMRKFATKKLLFILFFIYWILVYGISLVKNMEFKNQFREVFPTGYRMYAPSTTTNYEIHFEFYQNSTVAESFFLSDYIDKSYEKSIVTNKKTFLFDFMYQRAVKDFDYEYQMFVSKTGIKQGKIDFAIAVEKNPELGKKARLFENFSKNYLKENQELIVDSVRISFYRLPIVLPFDKAFREDFTYFAGKGIFYETTIKLRP